VNVFASQTEHIRALEAAGFADQAEVGEDSWSKVLMQRDAQDAFRQHPIPTGFVVRPLSGESEVEAYVALHQVVFETKNMTVEWRFRTLQQPAYNPDLDFVVAAPDGRLGAFCIGWLRRAPDGDIIGQIEPLGCHPDFRRYALGRLALAEVLRRMQALGVSLILVETDNYRNTALSLYESLGFRIIQDVRVFRKNYGGPE
jgi:ribosomal protein S18 acetylase RimI-like enzyme